MGRWVIGLCAAGALVAAAAASSQVVLAPTVYHSAALPSDSVTTFTVTCPPGHIAVSAGVSTAAPGVTTLSIRPAGARSFVFRFGNPSTNPGRTVTAAVACRKLRAGTGKPYLKLVRLKTKPVIVPVEDQKQVVIQCPKGTVAAGGGVDLAPPKGKDFAAFAGSPLDLRRQSSTVKQLTFSVRNAESKPHPGRLLRELRHGRAPVRLGSRPPPGQSANTDDSRAAGLAHDQALLPGRLGVAGDRLHARAAPDARRLGRDRRRRQVDHRERFR